MKGTMLVISPAGSIHASPLHDAPTLEQLRAGVGGHIELVPMFDSVEHHGAVHDCIAYCNEEGKLEERPPNHRATMMWDRALIRRHPGAVERRREHDFLIGHVVVLYGDEEFMNEQ